MKYGIAKSVSFKISSLKKGAECSRLLLIQVPKGMHEPLVSMFFPVLGINVSGCQFQHSDRVLKGFSGIMANRVAVNALALAFERFSNGDIYATLSLRPSTLYTYFILHWCWSFETNLLIITYTHVKLK